MKTIEVWIEGTTAILQQRFSEAAEQSTSATARRVQMKNELPRDAAEKSAYREPSGALYHPGAAIGRLLREAGGAHKQRGSRKSIKYVVPAAVLVLDDAIPLFETDRRTRLRDFEVDSRPVVIPSTKGRVMRHRPRHDAWAMRFTLRINEDVLDPATVRQLLVEGGQQIGIGDYRPEKGGPFGTFAVVAWSETGKVNGTNGRSAQPELVAS